METFQPSLLVYLLQWLFLAKVAFQRRGSQTRSSDCCPRLTVFGVSKQSTSCSVPKTTQMVLNCWRSSVLRHMVRTDAPSHEMVMSLLCSTAEKAHNQDLSALVTKVEEDPLNGSGFVKVRTFRRGIDTEVAERVSGGTKPRFLVQARNEQGRHLEDRSAGQVL